MIFDKHALFFNGVAPNSSSGTIDTKTIGPGPGEPLRVVVSLTPDASGVTGVTFTHSDDDSTYTTLVAYTGDFIGKSREFLLPVNTKRYIKMTVNGGTANGKVTAGVCLAGTQIAV